jgi:hypothetical protein
VAGFLFDEIKSFIFPLISLHPLYTYATNTRGKGLAMLEEKGGEKSLVALDVPLSP